MKNLDFSGLNRSVVEKIAPMVDDLLQAHEQNIHSFHIVGSAVISDYDEKLSDVNSVILLHNMDLRFIAFLAPLGKKFGKKRIAAPLVMTPDYIMNSLDAFPIEFLDFKLVHRTVYGTDLFRDVQIGLPELRLQCEREVKTKLIHLRQGYLSSLGKKDQISAALVRSFTGSMALLRAIILLLGSEPPIPRAAVVQTVANRAKLGSDIFETLLRLKNGLIRPTEQELYAYFERYYQALETLGKIIDDLRV
jgi:hypothetical protein